MQSVISASEQATTQLATVVAAHLRPGDVLALNGDLGAGKTRFVQGLAQALGCDAAYVHSPTFTLVQEYAGRLPLYHVDAYRLRDAAEFLNLGGEELLDSDGICCIEWAERIAELLPASRLRIDIHVVNATTREFQFQFPPAAVPHWVALEASLQSP